MTPESGVKTKVKVLLKKYDAYWHMPMQNGMGAPSLDFICCINGFYFAVECKAPGKVMTPRQENTAAMIRAAGGVVFVIDGSNIGHLESWLALKRNVHVQKQSTAAMAGG